MRKHRLPRKYSRLISVGSNYYSRRSVIISEARQLIHIIGLFAVIILTYQHRSPAERRIAVFVRRPGAYPNRQLTRANFKTKS